MDKEKEEATLGIRLTADDPKIRGLTGAGDTSSRGFSGYSGSEEKEKWKKKRKKLPWE